MEAIKLGCWEKVGNFGNIGSLNVLFKDTGDLGNPEIKISNDWWIWKINQKQTWVGKLKGKNKKAEIGLVLSPVHILERMRTGHYDINYPNFE